MIASRVIIQTRSFSDYWNGQKLISRLIQGLLSFPVNFTIAELLLSVLFSRSESIDVRKNNYSLNDGQLAKRVCYRLRV